MALHTASQTVGPYFHLGMDWPGAHRLVDAKTPGERVTVVGTVFDGDGALVPDALIELWQADANGRFHADAASGFRGFGRCSVDVAGGFRFETIKPGKVGREAPHLALILFARGLMCHLHTRVYFAEETALNAACPVLEAVPAARRTSLLARRGAEHHRFDIHLQGPRETVFFDA